MSEEWEECEEHGEASIGEYPLRDSGATIFDRDAEDIKNALESWKIYLGDEHRRQKQEMERLLEDYPTNGSEMDKVEWIDRSISYITSLPAPMERDAFEDQWENVVDMLSEHDERLKTSLKRREEVRDAEQEIRRTSRRYGVVTKAFSTMGTIGAAIGGLGEYLNSEKLRLSGWGLVGGCSLGALGASVYSRKKETELEEDVERAEDRWVREEVNRRDRSPSGRRPRGGNGHRGRAQFEVVEIRSRSEEPHDLLQDEGDTREPAEA